MAQDEKMLVPVEPTEAQIEAFRDWYFKHTGNGLVTRNAAKAVQTVLSAAPAQPAAGEGAAGQTDCKRCAGNGEIVTDWDRYLGALKPGDQGDEGTADCPDCDGIGKVDVEPARPSPTPAADVVRSQPDDPTEEMIQAALEVDFDNEDERGAVINLWHVMIAAAPPAADADRARIAVEAHCQRCGGEVQGWRCQSCPAEFREDDDGHLVMTAPSDALEGAAGALEPFSRLLPDGIWQEDDDVECVVQASHLRAAAKALAALKAGGVK